MFSTEAFHFCVANLAKIGLIVWSVCIPTQVPRSPSLTFQGTVAIVIDDHLVLATGRNERKTFLVPHDTAIVVNREEATLDDVMPGQFASITSGANGRGQLVATFINAIRQY